MLRRRHPPRMEQATTYFMLLASDCPPRDKDETLFYRGHATEHPCNGEAEAELAN